MERHNTLPLFSRPCHDFLSHHNCKLVAVLLLKSNILRNPPSENRCSIRPKRAEQVALVVVDVTKDNPITGAEGIRFQPVVLKVHLPTFRLFAFVPLNGIVRNASTLDTAAETPAATALLP